MPALCRLRDVVARRIEVAQKRETVAPLEHRDERLPHRVGCGRGSGVGFDECCSASRPRCAKERCERCPELLRSHRLSLEEREFPAVERLRERSIRLGRRKRGEQARGPGTAELVEPPRLASGRARRDRKDWSHTERAAVERLEHDRPGGERRSGREPDRTDSVRDLRGRIGRSLARVENPTQFKHETPVGLTPEARGQKRARLRPVSRHLALGDDPNAHPTAEFTRRESLEPHERRNGTVRTVLPKQGFLEAGIRMVERIVMPVESAAGLSNPYEQVEADGSVERLAPAPPRVGMREHRCGGLALKFSEREVRVRRLPQKRGVLLDEPPHERAVLVERRAALSPVLLEEERERALLRLKFPGEPRECSEREPAECCVE